MSFDWTTFVLECINFLVLVWILKRFFYRPVLQVLDARQQRIRDETARAAQLQAEADELKRQYESRLADWNRERAQARETLEQELQKQRSEGLETLRKTLAEEAAKARARDAALVAAREADLVRQASGEAYRHAALMLQRLATPDLTLGIAKVFREDLPVLPDKDRDALRKAGLALGAHPVAEIASAHPLDENTRAGIVAALSALADCSLQAQFQVAPELIAGLRVVLGESVLHANLCDELDFFKRALPHA